MLTEAEDHDIASNDDGLAIVGKSASTSARGHFVSGEHIAPCPGTSSPIESCGGPGEARDVGVSVGHSWRSGNAAQRR